MTVLSRYITVMFLRHTLMMVCGLSAVFMVFDILSNAESVTQNTDNTLQTLWHYIRLRFPTIFALIMPTSALLGTMMTMHKMIGGREMVAIGGAGYTIYKVSKIFVISAVFLAIIQLGVSEYIASDSSARLRLWADNNYAGLPPAAPSINKTLWAASDDYIIYYKTASADGYNLHEPFVVKQTKDGLVDDYIQASRASYNGHEWRLDNVYGKGFETASSEKHVSIKMNLGVHPDDFSLPAERFEEVRLSDLWRLNFTENSISHSASDLHQLWFQRKLAQPLSVILMVIMAAPMGLFMARQYNALLINFSLIMGGFLFLVSEQLLLSLGEGAVLPSFFAVWSPLLIFGTMSLWFMLYKQE